MAGPLYRQIAEDLRRRIDSGELAPGAQLPTEDELMAAHVASRNTVRGAIRELATGGIVETRHGKGTFVAEHINPIVTTLTTDPTTGVGGGEGVVYTAEVAASGCNATTGNLRVEIQKSSRSVAAALRVPEGSDVVSRQEHRFVDGRPWSLQTSFYPRSLIAQAPRLQDPEPLEEGTVKYLRAQGVDQIGYRDSLGVRGPDKFESDFFDLPANGQIQVFQIFRIAFGQHQNRVRLTITVYRADRNRFIINVGDVPPSD
ncbi:MAG: GntR family transcriptional regulator [Streptosporangiaceae bacterium]